MEKNRINDVKITATADRDWNVHRLSGGMQLVQRQYGLGIIAVNSGKNPPDGFDSCLPRYFEFYSLSHLISGRGRLWIEGGRELEMHPGDAVLITPYRVHRYGGSDGEWYCEDAVCFHGPVADMLRDSGVISDGLFKLGKVRRLPALAELAHDPAADAQINANFMLQQLLLEMYNASRAGDSGDVIDQLIRAIKARLEHWWTIKELASMANLSDDQLRRRFLERTGLLPKNYLEQLKMRKAAELLRDGRLRQQEVAHLLGYRDNFHFSRRFKNAIGVSPSRYRREFESGRIVEMAE